LGLRDRGDGEPDELEGPEPVAAEGS